MFPNTMEGVIRGFYEHRKRAIWECHACGRVAIDSLDETECKFYFPEDGKVGNLFEITYNVTRADELKKNVDECTRTLEKLTVEIDAELNRLLIELKNQ